MNDTITLTVTKKEFEDLKQGLWALEADIAFSAPKWPHNSHWESWRRRVQTLQHKLDNQAAAV